MSYSVSGANPVSQYLSIIQDEAKQVAAYVKSDPAIGRSAAAFQADTIDISEPTDILASDNLRALQVVLGAYGLGAQSTETGLLKQVLLQDPSSGASLVRRTGNTNYLDFHRSLTPRSTVTLAFGDPGTESFSTVGAGASTLSLRNLAYGAATSTLTAAAPAQSWDYVLNNGSAAPTIAAALTAALQATGTTASPVTGGYSVNAAGAIVGSAGAPAVASSTDKSGNTTYSLVLAQDSAGKTLRIATVVSINAADPTKFPQPTTLPATSATNFLAAALTNTGFSVARNGETGFSVVNPADNGPLSIAPNAFSDFAALTLRDVATTQSVLPLGPGGLALKAGQTLLSGGKLVGTVASVDSIGDVTLKAASAIALPAGSRIDVAIGAGIANIGGQAIASAGASTAQNVLELGTGAAFVKPGQILTVGHTVLGIVASADPGGAVTLTAKLAAPVNAGDVIAVLPQVTTGNTPGLQVASNAQSILSLYETNTYEAQQGKRTAGLDTALYFSRIAPNITNVNQLLSDSKLIKVITTNLGIQDSFSNLSFDQQASLLKAKVDFKDFNNPAKLKHDAEQYLLLTNLAATTAAANASVSSLFGNGPADGSGTDLLSTVYPTTDSSNGTSVVSLFSSVNDNSLNDSVSLFA